MITPEQFVKDYESYVIEWVLIRNSKNQTQVNAEDLWEKLLAKITINNILEMYYDDHVSTASFKTWLNKVLNNLYIDMAIAIANKEWVPISVGDSEENFGYAIDQDKFAGSKQKTEVDIDVDLLFIIIDQIPKIRDRILVKLKSFVDGKTEITDAEYNYLEEKCKMGYQEINMFISDNLYGHKAGLKDKDIALLLNMKPGSVNTTYKRIVIKYVIEPYNISRAKND